MDPEGFSIVSTGPRGYHLRFDGSFRGDLRLFPDGSIEGVWKSLNAGHIATRPEVRRWLSRHEIELWVPPIEIFEVIRGMIGIVRRAEQIPRDFWEIELRGTSAEWLDGTGSLCWTDLDALSFEPDFYERLGAVREVGKMRRRELLLDTFELIRRRLSS